MIRARQGAAGETHERFAEWLVRGPTDEPPRDLALHAAFCPDCRAALNALDLLSAIDTGRAPMPASRPAVVSGRHRPVRMRLVAAVASLAILAIAGWSFGSGWLPAPHTGEQGGSQPPAQRVLGGFGGGELASPVQASAASPSPSASDPAPSASDSASPQPVATQGSGTVGPGASVAPEPTSPSQPSASTRATRAASPSATPTRPPPPPSAAATPQPTPDATPTDDCADGIDNDGDLLIDQADPGCLLDGDEDSV